MGGQVAAAREKGEGSAPVVAVVFPTAIMTTRGCLRNFLDHSDHLEAFVRENLSEIDRNDQTSV